MRVLLIEDDSATAQVIELMLKSEGFNVYTTDLGEEGVDLGKLYDYDIILSELPQLQPIVAKKHFHRTGTQRIYQSEFSHLKSLIRLNYVPSDILIKNVRIIIQK